MIRQTDRPMHVNRWRDTQVDGQTDRQTDRQTGRQAGRQTRGMAKRAL